MKNSSSTTGFTLIELLVTIVIISVLAAIALATYAQFISKARHTEAIVIVKNVMKAQLASKIEEGEYKDNFEELVLPYSQTTTYFNYKIANYQNHSEIIAVSKIPLIGSVRGCIGDGYNSDTLIVGDAFKPLGECP